MRAWPALSEEVFGGWVARFAQGYSKRANSLNAVAPHAPFDMVIDRAEAFYAARGLPTVVRLSPLAPATIDPILAARGYELVDPSLVMVGPLDLIPSPVSPHRVELRASPDPSWVGAVAKLHELSSAASDALHAILRRINGPAVFATLQVDGQAVGHGCAVLDEGMIGLFEIVVAHDRRGSGHGRALVSGLLKWGWEQGARSAWLQVHQGNQAAINLYRSLGFAERYRYHYRVSGR